MSLDAALNSQVEHPLSPFLLRAGCGASLAHLAHLAALPSVLRGRGWPAAKQELLALMDPLLELDWSSSGLLLCPLCDGEALWGLPRGTSARVNSL